MPVKILLALTPLAVNIALGFATGKTANAIDSKVNSKALAIGFTLLLGGLSFFAHREFDKMFVNRVVPRLDLNS